MTDIGTISQVVGMAAMLLVGGIALGKLFSDNGYIKRRLEELVKKSDHQGELLAAQNAEMQSMEKEVNRVRNRLDEFIDNKGVSK